MSTTSRRFSSRKGEPTGLHHRPRPPARLLLTVVAAAGLRVYRLACAPTSTNDVEIGAPIAVRVDEKEHHSTNRRRHSSPSGGGACDFAGAAAAAARRIPRLPPLQQLPSRACPCRQSEAASIGMRPRGGSAREQ